MEWKILSRNWLKGGIEPVVIKEKHIRKIFKEYFVIKLYSWC